ncbi:hypothetical protein C3737_03690 [Aeromonas jandaei]|nr:hypothetical protein C3737_03690 [Aeromonas jandaei]
MDLGGAVLLSLSDFPSTALTLDLVNSQQVLSLLFGTQARAIGTPPRLRALCVENHAGERLGEGIGSPRQHWPRAGIWILFAILHFPSDPFRFEEENTVRCGQCDYPLFVIFTMLIFIKEEAEMSTINSFLLTKLVSV